MSFGFLLCPAWGVKLAGSGRIWDALHANGPVHERSAPSEADEVEPEELT